MPGRHPPMNTAHFTQSATGPTRRTVLRTVAAGAFATATGALVNACGSAAAEPPGKVAVHGDNPAWAEPLKAAGKAMHSVDGIEIVPEVIPSLESFEQVVKS